MDGRGLPRGRARHVLAAAVCIAGEMRRPLTIGAPVLMPFCVAWVVPAKVDARVFLPDCGISLSGGRIAPAYWDGGCTGSYDLIRTNWSRWAA